MTTGERPNTVRFLLFWAITFAIVLMAVWFLHEVAHGFGYRLEGTHVSTGFNRVGASGKAPGDPDFYEGIMEEGLTTGLLLGPFTNWMLAILFTALLLHRTEPDRTSLFFGVMATANSFMRLFPLVIFFVAALFDQASFHDEHYMSMGAIESITLPMSPDELGELVQFQPSLFLSDPGLYFWPAVSLAISLLCFSLTYRHLYRLFAARLQSRISQVLFGIMPLVLIFPILSVMNMLDSVIRINW